METDTNVLKYLSENFKAINKHIAEKRPEDKWIYDLNTKYYEDLYTAKDRGQPVIWMSAGTIPELFYAMDIFPVSPEGISSLLAGSREGLMKYLDYAQRYVPDHICGVNKGMIGAAMAGDLPLPDAIVHAAHPCDSGLASFDTIAEYLDVPHFCIDTPYTQNERSYKYMAGELKKVVSFLEEHTGRKLDEDRLREVVEYSNEALRYLAKINELRKNVPCPLSSLHLMVTGSLCVSMSGTPGLVEFYKKQYEIGKAAVEENRGPIPEEKIRLASLFTPVLFDTGIFRWMEREFGAMVVKDGLSNFSANTIEDVSDTESIFLGLAERLTYTPMGHMANGPYEIYSDMAINICRDYKADAAIFSGNFACKHAWATIKLVKDNIQDELGIPIFIFDIDFVDPRMKSSDTIKAQLQDFITTLIN